MLDLMKLKKELISFQVMLVGESGAGKSSLIMRYTKNQFDINTTTTLGIDFLSKSVLHRGKTVKMELWDTSGQYVFKSIPLTRFKRCNGLLFVYELTDMKSFTELQTYWIPTAAKQCPQGTVFAVFGNKSDMLENPAEAQNIKDKVEQKLQSLSNQHHIEFINFVGNCKEANNKGLHSMMDKMLQLLFNHREAKEQQQMQANRLAIERGQLPKVQRRSIVLAAQHFEPRNQTSTGQTVTRRRKC